MFKIVHTALMSTFDACSGAVVATMLQLEFVHCAQHPVVKPDTAIAWPHSLHPDLAHLSLQWQELLLFLSFSPQPSELGSHWLLHCGCYESGGRIC